MTYASLTAAVVTIAVSVAGAIIAAIVTARAVIKGARQQSIETEVMRLRYAMLSRRLRQFDQACARFLALAQEKQTDSTKVRQAADEVTAAASLVSGRNWEDLHQTAGAFHFGLDDWLDKREEVRRGTADAKELHRTSVNCLRWLHDLRKQIDRVVEEAIAPGGD
jgi:hypothetical protein